MNRIITSSLFVLLSLLLVGTDVSMVSAGSCSADVVKLCQGIKPGGGRVSACLKSHEQELSDECKTRLRRTERRALPVCQDDVEQLCGDVRPVGRRIIRCLLQNEANLSAECRDRLIAAKPKTVP